MIFVFPSFLIRFVLHQFLSTKYIILFSPVNLVFYAVEKSENHVHAFAKFLEEKCVVFCVNKYRGANVRSHWGEKDRKVGIPWTEGDQIESHLFTARTFASFREQRHSHKFTVHICGTILQKLKSIFLVYFLFCEKAFNSLTFFHLFLFFLQQNTMPPRWGEIASSPKLCLFLNLQNCILKMFLMKLWAFNFCQIPFSHEPN